MNTFLICASCFLTIFFLFLAFARYFSLGQEKVRSRMQSLQNAPKNEENEAKEGGKKILLGAEKIITLFGKILERRGIIKPLEDKMLKASIPLRGEEYLILWLLSTIIPGSLLFLVTRKLLSGLVICFIGFFVPPFLVKRAEQKKIKKFNQQLVDALSIISNSLRAGHSFMQAIELVSKEMPDPIRKEFRQTFREISLGTTLEEALHKLGRRVASHDLDLIITAVLIQRQIGGNLAEVMDNISDTIRDRIRIQGEIKTLTAQGRLSGLVIAFIPVFLIGIMLLLNPEYLMPLFKSSIGLMMFSAGIIGEIIGVILIKKIVTIDF